MFWGSGCERCLFKRACGLCPAGLGGGGPSGRLQGHGSQDAVPHVSGEGSSVGRAAGRPARPVRSVVRGVQSVSRRERPSPHTASSQGPSACGLYVGTVGSYHAPLDRSPLGFSAERAFLLNPHRLVLPWSKPYASWSPNPTLPCRRRVPDGCGVSDCPHPAPSLPSVGGHKRSVSPAAA